MKGSEIASRVGFFALVLVIVSGLAVVPANTGSSAGEAVNITVQSHQPENILVEAPAETGDVDLAATNGSSHVVFDLSHGNDVDRAAVDPLVSALVAQNHTVSFYAGDRTSSINDSLRRADAFVVIAPQEGYSPAERSGLQAFTDAGGRLLLAGEPPSQGSALGSIFGVSTSMGSPLPLNGIATPYGLSFGDGYVYDLESYDTNYRNVYASPQGSFGDASVTVHEATTVRGGDPILETADTATLSSDREDGPYPVAARSGNVIAVGDASIFDSEWVQRNDNEAFVGEVLTFLASAEKTPGEPAPPEPAGPTEPPTR